jgi:V8-like Glu-specific endopeptidase
MEPSTPLPLTIIGYPSNNYMTCIDFSQANILRSEVNCYLDSIGETVENVPELGQTVYRPNRTEAVFEVINHTSRAREGMKGAPILTVNSSGKFYAIGMHSHIAQSSAYSSGVYFDRKVLRAIQEIELKI